MKLYSWNVNGLRAILSKGAFQAFLTAEDPDIICLQETKAKRDQVAIDLKNYTELWHSAERAGYSGTAIFIKNHISYQPTTLPFSIDFSDSFGTLNQEGRVMAIELEHCFLVNVYTPNSKRSLERLDLRHDHWDPAILQYLKQLETTKPVVICGDFNAAHQAIDLARPKANHHNAGFTDEERQGIANLIDAGFIDTFRTLHPDQIQYTWWSHMGHARANNVGWRIDYFFISQALKSHLKSATIYDQVTGSDHCPISIELTWN